MPDQKPDGGFKLGTLGGSSQALGLIYTTGKKRARTLYDAFADHRSGRWGAVPRALRQRNNQALSDRSAEIVSVHEEETGLRFFIVTSADRSSTRVMLESELPGPTLCLLKGKQAGREAGARFSSARS